MNNSNSTIYRAVINSKKIQDLRNIYFKNSFVFICRNLIHSKVFENGLCLREANEKNCKGNPLTKQLMQSFWLPFAKDVIDSIICIGLVPIRYKTIQGNSVPYVPKAGTYEIHVVTPADGSTKYEFFSTDKPIDITKPTPNSFVLSGFGYDPERNGSLNSTIDCLYPHIRFISDMHDYAVIAERIRTNPPIIMQRRGENQSSSNDEGLHFDQYVDGDNVKLSSHNQFERDKKDIESLHNQNRLFLRAIEGKSLHAVSNTEKAIENMVPLPNQYNVGTTLQPSGRTDFVAINRLSQETICALIGVPRSMIINDSITRADIQGSHDVFRQTLIYWKKSVAIILTKVYRILYGEHELQKITKKGKKRKLKDIENFVESNLVTIEIPTTPYVSNDELRSLYLHGIISWKYFGEYMLRNASLPVDILLKKEPWKQEDRKQFLGGKSDAPNAAGASSSSSGGTKGDTSKTAQSVKIKQTKDT